MADATSKTHLNLLQQQTFYEIVVNIRVRLRYNTFRHDYEIISSIRQLGLDNVRYEANELIEVIKDLDYETNKSKRISTNQC